MGNSESLPPRRSTSGVPAVWGAVPQRNRYFTGRESLLDELRRQLSTDEVTALLPHSLHGMGGVGKTMLAVEYAYRFRADHQLVWWIPSDQESLARATLAALAPRLGLTGIPVARIEDALAAVLEQLRRGEPFRNWLLVFDNADDPSVLKPLMPFGTGHIIVTSRNHRWADIGSPIEVDVFERAESLEFLDRRVPYLAVEDRNKLAEDLGDLPLALEQAGALISETGMAVDVYRDLLKKHSSAALSEGQPPDYPAPVAAAWSVSVVRVGDETPRAMDLLRLCAFFGPEPIPLRLLDNAQFALEPPLRDTLADPILLGRAIRALGRYALARIDNHNKTIQVHRLIQKVIRDSLREPERDQIKHQVHRLLVGALPGDPDDPANWPRFKDLLAHAVPAGVFECRDEPTSRRLVKDLVRYLYATGDFSTAQAYGNQALDRWTEVSGGNDPDVLMMRRHVGSTLWAVGRYEQAFEFNQDTLQRMRTNLGEEHEETLIMINTHGADLRACGDFATARDVDERSVALHREVFGDDHPRTFKAANNLAEDYRILGQYQKAAQLHEENYRDRLNFYGHDNDHRVLYALDNLARALRHVGQLADARELAERVYELYSDEVRQGVLPADHPWVLRQAKSLVVTRRKTGALGPAAELAEDVYERYRRTEGTDHPDTLAAAVARANLYRSGGDLDRAAEQLEDTITRYGKALGPDHPYTHGTAINLAVVRRLAGDPAGARSLLERTLDGLDASLGRDNDYTLCCAANLASARADLGDVTGARDLGRETLQRFRAVLGEDNPNTLACAANLALDLAACGEDAEAAGLRADTLARYRATLGPDHLETVAAEEGIRIDLDFEPPPL